MLSGTLYAPNKSLLNKRMKERGGEGGRQLVLGLRLQLPRMVKLDNPVPITCPLRHLHMHAGHQLHKKWKQRRSCFPSHVSYQFTETPKQCLPCAKGGTPNTGQCTSRQSPAQALLCVQVCTCAHAGRHKDGQGSPSSL